MNSSAQEWRSLVERSRKGATCLIEESGGQCEGPVSGLSLKDEELRFTVKGNPERSVCVNIAAVVLTRIDSYRHNFNLGTAFVRITLPPQSKRA